MKAMIFLTSFIFIIGIVSATGGLGDTPDFGYNNLNGPIMIPAINYSTIPTVNNSEYFDGYSVSSLYTYYRGLLETYFGGVYCKLTGCTMTGDINLGNNDLLNGGPGSWFNETLEITTDNGNSTLVINSEINQHSCINLTEGGGQLGFTICNDGSGTNRLVFASAHDGYEWMWIDRDDGTINFLNDTVFTNLIVENINTSGLINGINLSEIVNNSLHLNQDNWYNDSNGWINWDGNSNEFNESKLATTYYNATQSQVIAGTIDGGTLQLTQHPDGDYDGITFNFSEASGSPGLDLRVNFTGVSDFNKGYMRYKTNSLSGDYPIIQLWDYDSEEWEGGYGEVSESSNEFFTITGDVLDSTDHVQDGVVQMRIYKAPNGNTQNEYYVDMITIIKGYATPSGNVDLSEYWRTDNPEDDGNYTTTGILNVSTLIVGNANIEDTYYLKSNPFGFWNDTYAIFNKTYADTLYADISVTGGNPFDQSLNTTDEVTFDNLTITGDATVGTLTLTNPSRASAYSNANRVINTGTWTKINLDTENFDTRNEMDITTNDRWTADETGYYFVNLKGLLSSVSFSIGEKFVLGLRKNGTEITRQSQYETGYGARFHSAVITDVFYLTAGDYLEMWVYHDSGANDGIFYGTTNNVLTIHRMS